MLKGTTRLVNPHTKAYSGVVYDRFVINIPSKIARDSQFPFKTDEMLYITVDPRKQTVTLKGSAKKRRKGKSRRP